MLIAELRGEYDSSRRKDSLVVTDMSRDVRAAIFINEGEDSISVAVDMPNKSGVLTYGVPFDVFLDALRAGLSVSENEARNDY